MSTPEVPNQRYLTAEKLAIENARKAFPDTPQRQLARLLYAQYGPGQIGYNLRCRSQASIYAAVRRHDAEINAPQTTQSHTAAV